MYRAICALLFVAVVASTEIDTTRAKFLDFQRTYGKAYASQTEFEHAFTNFKQNLRTSEELTKKNGGSARFGVTKFSDLSAEEFARTYLTADVKNFPKYPVKTDFSKGHNALSCSPSGDSFDWSTCGATTPVKNQGQCGSCWAFSATETIESYFALGGGQLTALSVEQIVDCDTQGQDQGCNGGFPSGAYSYVQSAGGIESESAYPYTAGGGESGTCNAQGPYVATVTNVQTISGESGLYSQTSVSSGGPVSVCVDASSWQNYQGGVLSSCGTDVDHCVQLTGYNNYGQSGAYWIVRNSWGEDWGENGFIWVEIGQDLCSIGDYATVVSASAATSGSSGKSSASSGSSASSASSDSTGTSDDSSSDADASTSGTSGDDADGTSGDSSSTN